METKVNYTVVGAFVLVLSAAIIFAIIWLSAGLGFVKYNVYQIFMKESVSGLSVDAPVEYNGVNVGTVSSIQIDPLTPRLVILLIKVKSGTPITRGTRAKINLRALSGIGYVFLEDKGLDLVPLVAEDKQAYPVITTEPSFFLQMDKALSELSFAARRISRSLELLLDDANLRSIKQILQATQGTMRLFVSQTLPAANQTINNLDKVARELSQIAGEVKRNPAMFIRGRSIQQLGPGEKADAE